MRLALLTGSKQLSPRSEALASSLADAGHDLTVRRLTRGRLGRQRLAVIADRTVTGIAGPGQPEVIWPDTAAGVPIADRVAAEVGAWVGRRPDWPTPTRDHMAAVPAHPELSVPVGAPVPEVRPWDAHRGTPVAGRHAGRVVVLAFRSTPASPAHHLRRALERAGVTVRVTAAVDLADHVDADAVVIVESPTPPVNVVGGGRVPVVFWVHHGEHHLDGNVRLAARHGADLVLLAHSWHLALRFSARVERFPFGVVPGLIERGPALADRPIDLALVGSLTGAAYDRRRRLVDQASSALDRVEARSGVTPREMAALYRDARSVLNDGGRRHRPITMRVFEAIGSGALLVSEPAPGLDLLFEDLYHPIGDAGLDGPALRTLLADPSTGERATAAADLAWSAHTYDHRVDLLFRLISDLDAPERVRPPLPTDPLDRFLHDQPYVQRILDSTGTVDAPGREVVAVSDLTAEPGPRSFDAVVVGPGAPAWVLSCGRRFVLARGALSAGVPSHPREVTESGDLTIFDLGAEGYDVATVGGPSALD